MNNVTIHVGNEILYYKEIDGELQCSREDDGGIPTVYVVFECNKGIIDGYALVEEACIALFVGLDKRLSTLKIVQGRQAVNAK